MTKDASQIGIYRTIVIAFAALIGVAQLASANNQMGMERLNVLLGEWRGVGDGKWGSHAAERNYLLILDGAFIQGRGLSVYPKQEKNQDGERHSSLSLYGFDQQRQTLVKREFDNEAFVATYYLDAESSTDRRLVFVAENLENVPAGWRARVTILTIGEDEFHELFELDTAKGEFELYVTTRFLRMSKPSGG